MFRCCSPQMCVPVTSVCLWDASYEWECKSGSDSLSSLSRFSGLPHITWTNKVKGMASAHYINHSGQSSKFSYKSHLCYEEKKIPPGTEPDLLTKSCFTQPDECLYAHPAGLIFRFMHSKYKPVFFAA